MAGRPGACDARRNHPPPTNPSDPEARGRDGVAGVDRARELSRALGILSAPPILSARERERERRGLGPRARARPEVLPFIVPHGAEDIAAFRAALGVPQRDPSEALAPDGARPKACAGAPPGRQPGALWAVAAFNTRTRRVYTEPRGRAWRPGDEARERARARQSTRSYVCAQRALRHEGSANSWDSGPSFTELGIGQFRTVSARDRPNLGRTRPNSTKLLPESAKIGPELGRPVPEQFWSQIGQIRPKLARNPSRVKPKRQLMFTKCPPSPFWLTIRLALRPFLKPQTPRCLVRCAPADHLRAQRSATRDGCARREHGGAAGQHGGGPP